MSDIKTDWRDQVEPAIATQIENEIGDLRQRIMRLEGALVYVKNFLPTPLKEHAEAALWPK